MSHPFGMTIINQYCAHLRFRHLSPATIRRRRETLAQVTRFVAPTELPDASPDDLEAFLSCRIAARTKHAYRSDMRMFYGWLVDKNMIAVSPASKLASVKVPKSLPRPLTVTDVMGALLFGRHKVRRMVALAVFAGMRCHEIAALQAEDVWLHGDPPLVIIRNGKGGRDRSVPIHPELVNLLRDLPPSGSVFPGTNAATMRPNSVSQAIAKHFAIAGIDGTPHQLRHTFGTELARQSGGDMILTAALMGHESMTTTMGYVRLTAGRAGDVVAEMYGGAAA